VGTAAPTGGFSVNESTHLRFDVRAVFCAVQMGAERLGRITWCFGPVFVSTTYASALTGGDSSRARASTRGWLGHFPLQTSPATGSSGSLPWPGIHAAVGATQRPRRTASNRTAVAQQSPGSRSAPWVGAAKPTSTPKGLYKRGATLWNPYRVRGLENHLTQGALRAPGLCCLTPSALANADIRPPDTHSRESRAES
jgi:hypothetical protein